MKRYIFIIAALTALIFSGCSNDDDRPVKTPIDPLTDIYGVVTDNQGNRLQGIVVSDGYTCTATDENGVYQLTAGEFSYQVYLSIPAAYEVPVSEGLPCFWQKLTEGRKRYDFTLTPLAGGAENEFNLFCVADPQCQNTTNIARFNNETVPDIAAQVAASALPSYGITLGDIGWNTENTDYTNDVFPLMKKAMQTDKVGLPLFQVMGNHDNKVIAVSKDNYTVAHDIAAQRNFEYIFGPVNYSFDRGNVHIIAMDNIIFPSHKDYSLGFRDDQVEWLRQDLSYVSKDKMVILCVHIPMRASGNQNVQAVFELLKPFAEVHVMSGHTHYAENNVYDSHYEHVHGAACGAWWNSTINVDGTPNGYAVYDVEGAAITDWRYKSSLHDESLQIRLHRGGDTHSGFTYPYTPKTVIANVWNADPEWRVTLCENGVETKAMTLVTTYTDAWSVGYHVGVLGRGDNYKSPCKHMYVAEPNDVRAALKVVAVDRWGNRYEQSEFTAPDDFTDARSPVY